MERASSHPRATEAASSLPWWVLLAPALVSALVYANTVHAGLPLDDEPLLLRIEAWDQAGWSSAILERRGLSALLHLLNHAAFGSWVPGHHLTNLVLSVLATGLVTKLLAKLTRSSLATLVGGLLFAVHPVHVEAVASIENRKDLLAMVFVCASMLAWMLKPRGPASIACALAAYAAAMWAKENAAVALVAMLFMYDVLLGGGPQELTARARRIAVWAVPPLAVTALAAFALFDLGAHARTAMEKLEFNLPRSMPTYWHVLWTVLAAVPTQLRLFVFPWRLSPDYPLPEPGAPTAAMASLGIAILFGCAYALLRCARREPLVSFGIAWTIVMFLPSSNVLPVIHFFVQDRFLYVPSFGLCLVAGVGVQRWADRFAARGKVRARGVLLASVALTLVALAARSVVRNRDWKDTHSVWAAAYDAGYQTLRIHRSLGGSLFLLQRYDEAMEHMELVLTTSSDSGSFQAAHGVLAESHFARGEYADAVEHYRALAGHVPLHEYRLGLAKSLLMVGERAEAESICRDVLAHDPGNADATTLLDYSAAAGGG